MSGFYVKPEKVFLEKKKEKQDFINSIWTFFTSMKVAVILILILAAVSVIGTVIPQQHQQGFYESHYELFWYKTIMSLGFNDLYNSGIYRFILLLVGINIAVCSVEHFNKKVAPEKVKVILPVSTYKNKSFFSFLCDKDFNAGKLNIISYLKKKGFSVISEDGEENFLHLYVEKGYLKPWGVFILHIGILVIFAGAIYGSFTGFKDQAFLVETSGETYKEEHCNFEVELKEFRLEADENGRVKDYYSELEVFEDGKKVLEKTIEVNYPLEYKGVVFYQSSWGMAGLEVTHIYPGGEEVTYIFPLDERGLIIKGENFFVLPDKSIVMIEDFYPDAEIKDGAPVNRSYMPLNPAITFHISHDLMECMTTGEEPEWEDLGLVREGKETKECDGHRFRFNRVLEYSVLQVKKDPGIPVVYFGSFLLMVGMMMAFYIERRIIRAAIEKDGEERVKVYVRFIGPERDGDSNFLEDLKTSFGNP